MPLETSELAAADLALLQQTAKQSFLYSCPEWFEHLYRHGFPPGGRLCHILTPPSASPASLASLASWLPVILRKENGEHRVEGLSNYYTPLFSPLLAPGSADSLSQAFVQFLREQAPKTDIVNLRPMDQEDPFLKSALVTLSRNGYWADTYYCFGNWYLEVAGRSYADYFSGLTSNIRKNMARRVRKLTDASYAIKIVTANGPDLEWAIEAYEQIYNKSWKQPEPYPEFIPGLCRLAAEQGWLRLGVLTIGDLPIAAQLWLVKNGEASIYKLAYVEGYEKLSAGTVLTCEMMRHAIDLDKVDIVDYGMGDDPYKMDWMSHRRTRVGLIAFRKSRPRGVLAAMRHFGGKWLKLLLKRKTLALES